MPETREPSLALDEAEDLARSLMRAHGLLDDNWQFRWSNAKKRLGCASIRKVRERPGGPVTEIKTISISRHLVRLNPASEVHETILHEIAHALAGLEHGHDAVWRATCRRIGARPQRLAGEDIRVAEPRYVLQCTSCKQAVQRRYKRIAPARLKASYCSACGPDAIGKLRLIDHG